MELPTPPEMNTRFDWMNFDRSAKSGSIANPRRNEVGNNSVIQKFKIDIITTCSKLKQTYQIYEN